MNYPKDEISITIRKAIRLWQIVYLNLGNKLKSANQLVYPHFGMIKLLINKDQSVSISLGKSTLSSKYSYDRLKQIDDKGKHHIFKTTDQVLIEYIKEHQHDHRLNSVFLPIWPSTILSMNDASIRAKIFDLLSINFKNGFAWKDFHFFTNPGEFEQLIIQLDLNATDTELDMHNTIIETIECLELMKV